MWGRTAFLVCVALTTVGAQSSVPTRTEPFKGRLYAVVSHWPPDEQLKAGDAALAPPEVRGRFERFAKCHASFKSRLPDSDSIFAALSHRRALEHGLACLIEAPDIAALAADYAAHAGILYEWEGMSESPLSEAAYAETYISDHPKSPLLPYLYLFVAERARYAFELLEGEKDPEGMTTQAARYRTFIARARSADPMVALVANDFDGLSFVYTKIGKHPRDYRAADATRSQAQLPSNADWVTYTHPTVPFSFRHPPALTVERRDSLLLSEGLVAAVDVMDRNGSGPVLRFIVSEPAGNRLAVSYDETLLHKVCNSYQAMKIAERDAVSCVTCGRASCHWAVHVLGQRQFAIMSFLPEEEGKAAPADGTFPLLTMIRSLRSSSTLSAPQPATQLDSRIGPAVPSRYSAIRDARNWLNPFLAVCAQGVDLTAVSVKHKSLVSISDLRATLIKLPLDAWPYGRIVGLQECSIGTPGDEHASRERSAAVEAVLKALGLQVSRWPA
jgi:hypothetical protein